MYETSKEIPKQYGDLVYAGVGVKIVGGVQLILPHIHLF